MKVALKRIYGGFMLGVFRRLFIRQKLLYFLQTNELYLVNSDNKILVSLTVKYKIYKNKHMDKILKLELLKTGSAIDDRLKNYTNQLQALFDGEVMKLVNKIDKVEYNIMLKKSKNEEFDLFAPAIKNNPMNGYISLSKYNRWNYLRYPSLLLAGNSGTGKSYLLFYVIKKLQEETSMIFVCDGKTDELYRMASSMGIDNNARNYKEIIGIIKKVHGIMDNRYNLDNKEMEKEPVFLVIDEFAALQLVLDKKIFAELNNLIKDMILRGRASRVFLIISLQRASSQSIDLAIRDNCAVKVGLGNLSRENFEMIFGENKSENELLDRDIGEGYISISGKPIESFYAPIIRINNTVDKNSKPKE